MLLIIKLHEIYRLTFDFLLIVTRNVKSRNSVNFNPLEITFKKKF